MDLRLVGTNYAAGKISDLEVTSDVPSCVVEDGFHSLFFEGVGVGKLRELLRHMGVCWGILLRLL